MPSSSEFIRIPGTLLPAPLLKSLPAPLLATVLLVLLPQAASHAQQVRMLVQSSPLAGYNHHGAAAAFPALRIGDPLVLVREPDNPHDPNAVRVEWDARMLGYVPRSQNAALAWALDSGEAVSARISRLQRHRSPSRRVEFEVYVD